MDWFNDHPVLFALICAIVGVGYGLYLTYWLLGRPAGSERMQEIGRAVQEGVAHQLEAGQVVGGVAAVPAGGVIGGTDAVTAVPGAQGGGGDAELARYCGNAQL